MDVVTAPAGSKNTAGPPFPIADQAAATNALISVEVNGLFVLVRYQYVCNLEAEEGQLREAGHSPPAGKNAVGPSPFAVDDQAAATNAPISLEVNGLFVLVLYQYV
jgi:hypothetical protein